MILDQFLTPRHSNEVDIERLYIIYRCVNDVGKQFGSVIQVEVRLGWWPISEFENILI